MFDNAIPKISFPRKVKKPLEEIPGAGERRLGKTKRLFHYA
jgi:hypothetical protein